jgi:hypothetical protein
MRPEVAAILLLFTTVASLSFGQVVGDDDYSRISMPTARFVVARNLGNCGLYGTRQVARGVVMDSKASKPRRPQSNAVAILELVALVGLILVLRHFAARGRPGYDDVQIEDCRSRYALAHSRADTLKVDYRLVPRSGGIAGHGSAPSYCGVYRATGHF